MRLFEKCMALFTVLLIFFVVGCGGDDNDSENTERGSGGLPSADWDSLTQSEKNMKILTTAFEDIDVMVKRSCKVWVQDVVSEATGGYRLPLNDVTKSDRWIEDEHNRVFGWGAGFNSSTDIRLADPGAIVQIRWVEGYASDEFEKNLHTAIVVDVSENYIAFIESNFDGTTTADDAYVRTRIIPVGEFYKNVDSFTVYYVN